MPYCCKCGVEVDFNITNCPLCDFSIPKIEPVEMIDSHRFPIPQNIHTKKVKKIKRNIFKIITVILLSIMGLAIFQNITELGKLTWGKYSTVSIIASLIYLFFLFGFIPDFKASVIGISINTIFLLYFLDVFNGKIEWFIILGLPSVFMGTISIIIFTILHKRTKKKGLNIVSYILISISLYCVVIESFISLYLNHFVHLYWSIIVSILLAPLAVLFLYLHYGLPEKYKVKLERKFHI